jgi:hypothetical protein
MKLLARTACSLKQEKNSGLTATRQAWRGNTDGRIERKARVASRTRAINPLTANSPLSLGISHPTYPLLPLFTRGSTAASSFKTTASGTKERAIEAFIDTGPDGFFHDSSSAQRGSSMAVCPESAQQVIYA